MLAFAEENGIGGVLHKREVKRESSATEVPLPMPASGERHHSARNERLCLLKVQCSYTNREKSHVTSFRYISVQVTTCYKEKNLLLEH